MGGSTTAIQTRDTILQLFCQLRTDIHRLHAADELWDEGSATLQFQIRLATSALKCWFDCL